MMNKQLQKSTSAGFTLIEMLVVVIMIGILFAIAAPSWVAFLSRQRTTDARDQIAQALRTAQAEAIRTRRSQTVTVDPSADPPTLTVKGISEKLGNSQFTPGMVTLQASVNTINFDDRGNLASNMNPPLKLTVTARSTGAKRCVIVQTLLGATRLASDADCN